MENIKNLQTGKLNEIYGSLLTAKQEEYIKLYFDYDLSLAEIGELDGVTRQAVRDAILRGEKELKEIENKLGILSKREKIIDICNQIIDVDKSNESQIEKIISLLYN